MNKTLRIIIIVAILAASATGIFFWQKQTQTTAQAEALSQVVTDTAERGAVEAIVVATGSLAPERSQTLYFSTAGKVASNLVEDGSTVQEGTVLATLDDETLQLNLASAQAAVNSAEAQLARAQKGASEEAIVAAQASLDAAEASLAALYEGPSDESIRQGQLQIDQAKNSLWSAQAYRDATAGNPMAGGAAVDQAEAQVLNAEVQVQLAEMQYELLFAAPTHTMVKNAELQVAQARSNLTALISSPTPEDIAAAEASVEQASINLQLVQKQLDDLELTAPFDGHLEGWDVRVGDVASPSLPLATLVDDSSYHIDVYIDETEIGQVQVGQSTRIEVDAFPGELFDGSVESISLLGQSAQGIVTYRVRVTLEESDLTLRPQLTAVVDIVTSAKEGALLVSNRALRRDENGKYVEILDGQSFEKLYVNTGLVGDQYTEVVSGMTEGQEYVLSRPADNTIRGPFGGF